MGKPKKGSSKEAQKTVLGFSLFIDRDRARAMNMLFNVYQEHREMHPQFFRAPEYLPAIQGVESMLDSFATPFHDMGWCEDPHCAYYDVERNNENQNE